MIIKFIRREMCHNRRFVAFFILNLTIGLSGFIALDAFKRSFAHQLGKTAKTMQTSDLRISSRQEILPDRLDLIESYLPPEREQTAIISLYSMLRSEQQSTMVTLRAIDAGYPLYGRITLEKTGDFLGINANPILEDQQIWVAPELATRLAVKIGDTVKIGDLDFTIADVIIDDVALALASDVGLAPTVYLGMKQLASTGLWQDGSTFNFAYHYKFNDQVNISSLEKTLQEKVNDPTIRIRSYEKATDQQGRIVGYLSDYLGLVALVAFFLSAIGAAYLIASFVHHNYDQIAILRALGMTGNRIMAVYASLLGLLGMIASLLASLLAYLILPILIYLMNLLTPITIQANLTSATITVALIMGFLGAIAISLPLLLRISAIKPSELFHGCLTPEFKVDRVTLLAALPLIIGFYFLCIWQAHSWVVGSWYFLVMSLSVMVLTLFGLLTLRLVLPLTKRGRFSLMMGVRYVTRSRINAMSCFVALAVGTLLLNVIPLLRASLIQELRYPSGVKLPTFFLIDIQEEQKARLETLLQQMKGEPELILSPIIRARVSAINNEAFVVRAKAKKYTREEEEDERMRNRGVNLSYRENLASSEALKRGRHFQGKYAPESGNLPEVSLETHYADRLGVGLNDIITFEVQGLQIKGRIISLREVKWNSFQPNFFIQFQPGVLEDVPKSYLGSLIIPAHNKQQMQNEIVDSFPNISIIDVEKVVERVSILIEQMSFILNFMALLSLVAGAIVLFSITNYNTSSRRWDMNLVKVLGGRAKTVFRIALVENMIIALAAAVFGSAAGALVSFILTKILFKGLWQYDPLVPLMLLVSLVLITLFTVAGAVWSTMRRGTSYRFT